MVPGSCVCFFFFYTLKNSDLRFLAENLHARPWRLFLLWQRNEWKKMKTKWSMQQRPCPCRTTLGNSSLFSYIHSCLAALLGLYREFFCPSFLPASTMLEAESICWIYRLNRVQTYPCPFTLARSFNVLPESFLPCFAHQYPVISPYYFHLPWLFPFSPKDKGFRHCTNTNHQLEIEKQRTNIFPYQVSPFFLSCTFHISVFLLLQQNKLN